MNIVSESQIQTEDERRRSPVHQEFLAKLGLTRSLLSSFTLAEGERGFLGVHRGERFSAHDASERRLFQTVLPHIEQALRISGRLAILELWGAAASVCFETLPYGIVLLDNESRVVLMNLAARRMVEENDGLCLVSGRVIATDCALQTRLTRDVQRMARSGTPREGAREDPVVTNGYLSVARPSGRRAYQLLVAALPLASVLALEAPVARVVLFLSDPSSSLLGPTDHWRVLFGLTPAEAQLAVFLAAGGSLEEYAGQAIISIETARSQLKRVFAKTETHRQGELVALLSRLPPSTGATKNW